MEKSMIYRKVCIIKDHNVLINGKNVYDQPIGSDIKGYDKIGKLTVYDYPHDAYYRS